MAAIEITMPRRSTNPLDSVTLTTKLPNMAQPMVTKTPLSSNQAPKLSTKLVKAKVDPSK